MSEKICKLLVTKEDGQEVGATLRLKDGKVTGIATPGYEALLHNVMNEDVGPYTLKSDPQNWFDNLPKKYSGSMLRAQMVTDSPVNFGALLGLHRK